MTGEPKNGKILHVELMSYQHVQQGGMHRSMSIEKTRETIQNLRLSAEALAALGVAIELRLGNTKVTDAKLEQKIEEVVRHLGLLDELNSANVDALGSILAEIRGIFLGADKFLSGSRIESGWTHDEEDFLQNQGSFSAIAVPQLRRVLFPKLDGLSERLESPSASFLDVGVGVAGLSIAMARAWPNLKIVGIDPWGPALDLAQRNVANAGLIDRIELRKMKAQDISDKSHFDLVWFPVPFIPRNSIYPSLQKIKESIRPGGWILTGAATGRSDNPLTQLLADVRTLYWGGEPITPSELEAVLRDSGFGKVRVIPGPPWSFFSNVVGCVV